MSEEFKTTNPFTGKNIKTYHYFTETTIEKYVEKAEKTFGSWSAIEIAERTKLLKNLSETLLKNKMRYSELMTNEMGKPISQSIAEIEKCVFLSDFYAKNAEQFLSDELIETDANESFISFDPLGCILAIMPWNYPFWQVLRFAIPTLTAGNTALLKHAANVTGCALAIQELFEESGFPKGCFQTLIVNHDQIESIIRDDRIKAISLTGSEKAGRQIAEIAGKHLKKVVLELGGNNACIVLADADLKTHMDTMVNARMQNAGQSCIAAKRFIVVESIYDKFIDSFKQKVETLTYGDPMEKDTDIATLARPDLADTLKKQVDGSIKKGANVLIGNKKENAFFSPTILTNVKSGMATFDEETFGPVASIIKVKNKEEAYEVASKTKFGLGTMVFTKNTKDALKHSLQIKDGAFFINELVKSDPRLPFGGTKSSGYGRELSREGILEFVNKKTIYINH